MARLPPYHIDRPRLSGRCVDERVVVVEAGGGYGKTTLGAELVDLWRTVGIEVLLLSEGVSAALFAARLRAAVAHSGFSEAAAAMAGAGDDPQGAVDAAVSALSTEQCAFVVDDVHHASREAAQLIEHLASSITLTQHAVVLARQLPPGSERLRRAEYLHLSAADLALDPGETLQLCREGFGLDVGPGDSQAVDEATGGWTAAAVLAVSRARRTGEQLRTVAETARTNRTSGAVAAILEGAITSLSASDRTKLAQVARLPYLDEAVVDTVAGRDGFFARCLEIGVPLTRGSGVWWDIPGPVRDHLVTLAPPDPVALRWAAASYEQRGELSAALQLLLGVEDDMAAADLFANAAPADLEAMDVLEVQAVVGALGEEALKAHPIVFLHLARSLSTATLMSRREAALRRVEVLAEGVDSPSLQRAIACERAKDLVRDGEFEKATALAADVLDSTPPDELLNRAGALAALGRALVWRFDPQGRRDETSLNEADERLGQAMDLYQQLGMRASAAVLVLYRAMWIEFARGHPYGALERLRDGLSLVVDRPRTWALLLIQRAEVELELGLFDESEATMAETLRLAEVYDDEVLRAYTFWEQSIVASHRGDREAVLTSVRLTEQHKGDWWDYASADFLASAAESLARVGETALAWDCLARGREDPQDALHLLALAEGVLNARFGDPELAEQQLREAPGQGVDPREYWRMTLFRALAAFRRDDPSAGALAARAFEEASRLGLGHLPLTKERAATEQVLGLAVETGQPAALALEAAALPTAIRVLGTFSLTSGGHEVAVSPGQGRRLLQMLAVSGGRFVTDQAMEALWPDADPDAARNRLRTVLNRLRTEAGDVVVRSGETLELRSDVSVDLALFEADARRSLALGAGEPTLAVALARSAMTRYRGELLPEEPYEDWAARPRERARRTMLQLLDLCADVAANRGDLDDMRRVVEMTIDLAPYDDDRYLRAASLLLQQGRRGAALMVVRRARHALAEIGLEPPVHLLRLEEEISA
jgi:DNA-binding SARP family transcriptional activator/ATP/maltotriose-dependent transcriptional regulator MalT